MMAHKETGLATLKAISSPRGPHRAFGPESLRGSSGSIWPRPRYRDPATRRTVPLQLGPRLLDLPLDKVRRQLGGGERPWADSMLAVAARLGRARSLRPPLWRGAPARHHRGTLRSSWRPPPLAPPPTRLKASRRESRSRRLPSSTPTPASRSRRWSSACRSESESKSDEQDRFGFEVWKLVVWRSATFILRGKRTLAMRKGQTSIEWHNSGYWDATGPWKSAEQRRYKATTWR